MKNFAWALLRGAFKKPATTTYFGGDMQLDSRVRGLLKYDKTACVASGLCMKDCPTGAIKVVNEGTKDEKDMHAYLDTGKCIFCGQCADSCAKKCLSCSNNVDLAKLDKDGLTVEL